MKRVLCILSSLDAGGAETFLMKVSRALSAREYQLDFVVSAEDGCYTQEVLDRGGRIFFVPMRTKNPRASFAALQKVVKENHYTHVLKLGNSPIAVVDLLAAKQGGAKVLAMRSCNAPVSLSFKQKLIDALFRPILNRVATVKIAPSDLAACYTFGQKQYNKGNVHLLNNGVDLDVFRYDPEGAEKIRTEFALHGKTVYGHVGRFNKQKNHKFLLEIFAQVCIQQENAVLLLVGKGELEQQIRQQADMLGIAERIVFTGVRSDIPQLLSAMDVFVFPSFHEGMPNTVIEAQATGLPCVIADTITKTADITGLVEYLPLSMSAAEWAQQAMMAISCQRCNTKDRFMTEHYDIDSVVEAFKRYVFEH